jgi:hypothetical protein
LRLRDATANQGGQCNHEEPSEFDSELFCHVLIPHVQIDPEQLKSSAIAKAEVFGRRSKTAQPQKIVPDGIAHGARLQMHEQSCWPHPHSRALIEFLCNRLLSSAQFSTVLQSYPRVIDQVN